MNDAPAESKPETESNKAARKRLRKQPPPDPAPLAGLIAARCARTAWYQSNGASVAPK